MDVERIQKINNLALDLMQQGLAKDREDAISQAEKIFRDGDKEDYNQIRETMQEIKNDSNPRINEKQQDNKNEDLSSERVSQILEKNTNFLVKKIKEFQEKIDYLEREISNLRGQMINCRNQTSQTRPTVNEVPVSSEPNQQPQEKPKEEKTNHPRSGDYNENDVSIEKFFYMGSK